MRVAALGDGLMDLNLSVQLLRRAPTRRELRPWRGGVEGAQGMIRARGSGRPTFCFDLESRMLERATTLTAFSVPVLRQEHWYAVAKPPCSEPHTAPGQQSASSPHTVRAAAAAAAAGAAAAAAVCACRCRR